MRNVSRRQILEWSAAGVAMGGFTPPASPLTVAQVLDRIRGAVGIPWRTETVDRLVAGSPELKVTGVAATMMATLEVLERAAAGAKNLVITHETPWYLHQDRTDDLADDPTFQYKTKFVRDHNLAVFHFHDHWHARHPDGIATGMARQLGWQQYQDPGDPRRFALPEMSLLRVVEHLHNRLGAGTMRVLGDPNLAVKRLYASWGFVSRMPGIAQFREANTDVFIAGETREWELVEYAEDTIRMGARKALIVLGHVVSEQSGMAYCVDWLRPLLPEVDVSLVPAQEPFWPFPAALR